MHMNHASCSISAERLTSHASRVCAVARQQAAGELQGRHHLGEGALRPHSRPLQVNMRLTAYLASRQGLQKWWPQGVDSGSTRTPLHSVQVNSRSARSCSDACAGGANIIRQAVERQNRHSSIECQAFLTTVCNEDGEKGCSWENVPYDKIILELIHPVQPSGCVWFRGRSQGL